MVAPLVAVVGAVGAIMTIGSFASPLGRGITYGFNKAVPNLIPDAAALIELRWKRLISEEDFRNQMKSLGFSEQRTEFLFQASQNILNPLELINLKRRGLISEEQFYADMKRNKVTQETADHLLKTSEYLPGPSDMIRFLVREVFKDDVAKQFGYDDDFPSEALAEAAKIGMPGEIVKQYWRAHWELPSTSMALEMFHRLRPEFEKESPVTDSDIDTLLKIQDILPFWRERIKKISFALPTRVDIRFMVKAGIITTEKAEAIYNQMGYAPEDAKNLTNLAIAETLGTERDLTKAMIEDALQYGELDEETAIKLLEGLNYSTEEAEVIVSIKIKKIAEEFIKRKIKVLTSQFVHEQLDKDALITELDNLGISAIRRDLIVEEVEMAKQEQGATAS